MRIGWLGGSFNPVHRAHIQLALAAFDQFHLDRVYLVLSPRSPFKENQTQVSVAHRSAMLTRACQKKSGLFCGRFELKSKKISYTVHSLRAYKKKHPSHDLFLILGSDAWAGFDRWKNPEEILSLAHVLVGRRPKINVKKFEQFVPPSILKGVFPTISSTVLRRHLSQKQLKGSQKFCQKNLDPGVYSYIQKHNLYGQ